MLSIFVSGLNKHTGKTIVTAGIAGTMQSLSYSTSVYKPIETSGVEVDGGISSTDISAISNFDSNIKTTISYLFKSPSTPLAAAYESNNTKIDIQKIYNDYQTNIQMTECHIVEGTNSIASPIDETRVEADIVKTLGLPLLLVLNPKKSTIEDAIMGINYVNSQHLNLLGVIVNNYEENSFYLEEKYFPQFVEEYTNAKILGTLPHYSDMQKLTPETLIADVLNNINIEDIFGLKIAKLNM